MGLSLQLIDSAQLLISWLNDNCDKINVVITLQIQYDRDRPHSQQRFSPYKDL